MSYDKVSKIWSGPASVPLENPNKSIGADILESLKRNPTKIAQVSTHFTHADKGLNFYNEMFINILDFRR